MDDEGFVTAQQKGHDASHAGFAVRGWLVPEQRSIRGAATKPWRGDITAAGQVSQLGSVRFVWSSSTAGSDEAGGWAALIDSVGHSVYGSTVARGQQVSVQVEGGTGRHLGARGWLLIVHGLPGRSSWAVEGELSVGVNQLTTTSPPDHHPDGGD